MKCCRMMAWMAPELHLRGWTRQDRARRSVGSGQSLAVAPLPPLCCMHTQWGLATQMFPKISCSASIGMSRWTSCKLLLDSSSEGACFTFLRRCAQKQICRTQVGGPNDAHPSDLLITHRAAALQKHAPLSAVHQKIRHECQKLLCI